MKQKGKLSLINHTIYDWIKTDQRNYNMHCWHFPEIITANSTVVILIEWKEENPSANTNCNNSDGVINYVLFGSRDRSFQIRACSEIECDIQVNFLNLATKNCPLGSKLDLAWNYRDDVHFKLLGMADEFDYETIVIQ